MRRSAVITDDGLYRYLLDRQWSEVPDPSTCCWVMLNPSTADAETEDATLETIIRLSAAWGHDALTVVNRFAYRSPEPCDLAIAYAHGIDVTGPGNRAAVQAALASADRIVVGWGASATVRRLYPTDVVGIHDQWRGTIPPLECVGTNKDGSPKHPLYSRNGVRPVPWDHGRMTA